jgi:hypothetical protein
MGILSLDEFNGGGGGSGNKGGKAWLWIGRIWARCNPTDQLRPSSLESMAIMDGGTSFLEAARKNSKTGRRDVQALAWVLERSKYWNFDERIGISVAGQRDLASKIEVRTKGGTIKLLLPRKTENRRILFGNRQ